MISCFRFRMHMINYKLMTFVRIKIGSVGLCKNFGMKLVDFHFSPDLVPTSTDGNSHCKGLFTSLQSNCNQRRNGFPLNVFQFNSPLCGKLFKVLLQNQRQCPNPHHKEQELDCKIVPFTPGPNEGQQEEQHHANEFKICVHCVSLTFFCFLLLLLF